MPRCTLSVWLLIKPSRSPTAAITAGTVKWPMQSRSPRRQTRSRQGTQGRLRSISTVLLCVSGPVRSGSAAPDSTTKGVPSAAPMCIGPVSQVSSVSARASAAPNSFTVSCPARSRMRGSAAATSRAKLTSSRLSITVLNDAGAPVSATLTPGCLRPVRRNFGKPLQRPAVQGARRCRVNHQQLVAFSHA